MDLVNLKELIKYHPYDIGTFANFANITTDLLRAVIKGEEEQNSKIFRRSIGSVDVSEADYAR